MRLLRRLRAALQHRFLFPGLGIRLRQRGAYLLMRFEVCFLTLARAVEGGEAFGAGL